MLKKYFFAFSVCLLLVLSANVANAVDEIWREAESADSIQAPLQVLSDTTASNGEYIAVEAGKNSTGGPDTDAIASYNIKITEGGTYRMYVRVLCETGGDGDDSFYYRIDGADFDVDVDSSGWINGNNIDRLRAAADTEDWFWEQTHQYQEGDGIWPGPVVEFDMEAGNYTVEITYREDGLRIDGFLITNKEDIDLADLPDELPLVDAPIATKPNPSKNATGVSIDAEISWLPGIYADTHNVFLGTDINEVKDATLSANENVDVFEALDVNSVIPGRLAYDTDYYWRVDEVNAPENEGTNVGQVWMFTTESEGVDLTFDNIVDVTADAPTLYYEAQEPNMTCNESGLDANDMHSTDVDNTMWLGLGAVPGDTWIQYEFDQIYKFHEMLVWNYNEPDPGQGFGAKEVNISYSEDGQVWKSLGDLVHLDPADGADGYAANNTVDLDGAIGKFIKIELYNCWYDIPGGGLSEVRFSIIPTRVTTPDPEDEAEDVKLEQVLSWEPGRGVVSHTVYIGSDPNEVKAGNADIIADTDELMYSPVLALAKTYYWKVDEVNDNEEYPVWDGPVWSFSTIDSILIDGFEEGYGDADTNAVYATWKDGYNDPSTNGSVMGNVNIPYLSETALSGDYSSPMSYDNSVADYSEVVAETANLPIATSDWSVGSPSTLTIWFMGDSNNIIGDSELYCKIGGKTATYSGSLEVLTRAKWYQWAIDIDALNVNLSNIPDITIGIKNVGSQAGSGEILLDDIMLTGIAPFSPVTIYIEAEDADSITSGMSVQDANEGFFGTGYIASDSSVTENQSEVKEDGTLDGVATYTIEIPETGVYKIGFRDWVFTDVNDDNFNSFWVKLSGSDVTVDANLADNSGWANNNEIAAGGWVWADVVDNSNLGVGLNYTIGEAGTYTLQVAYREYRNRLDAIEIRKVGELKEE